MKYLPLLLTGLLLAGLLACTDERTVDIRVMSYNIRHGEGLDGRLDLSRSAAIIRAVSPDLCGLQEIDNVCSRSGDVDQTAYLAEQTSLAGTFGKFMDYQGGEYGMATLLSKPAVSSKVLKLPDGLHEPRSSIFHEVAFAQDCTIAFANVHFDWISGEAGSKRRLLQARVLVDYLDSLGRPATIITGDFNCTPGSPTMQYFEELGFVFVEKGADNLSFQGEEAGEIDHLIYRDSDAISFKPKTIELLDEPVVSDHRPLVVELEITY